jgi:hypothetical protein
MATRFPLVNPVRFQKTTETIDYTNNMPRFDLMRLGEDYQRGIYANKNYVADFKLNKKLTFIMQTSGAGFVAKILRPDGSFFTMNKEKITPASWVGDDYYKFFYTPTSEGIHVIYVDNGSIFYQSDSIYVSDPINLKDLVEIEYYDTQNRLDGFWFDEITQVWSPRAYYTGQIVPQQPENEISLYEDDGGVVIKTRSVPKRIAQLRVINVHLGYLDIINFQLQCSNVYINGVKYTAQDIALEEKEKSDLINVTAKLTQSEEENGYLLT